MKSDIRKPIAIPKCSCMSCGGAVCYNIWYLSPIRIYKYTANGIIFVANSYPQYSLAAIFTAKLYPWYGLVGAWLDCYTVLVYSKTHDTNFFPPFYPC